MFVVYVLPFWILRPIYPFLYAIVALQFITEHSYGKARATNDSDNECFRICLMKLFVLQFICKLKG